MKYLIRALEREGVQPGRHADPGAEEAPAADAVRLASLATTDLEPITDGELRRMLGAEPVCRFSYGAGKAAVAAATMPGAGDVRGIVKLHGPPGGDDGPVSGGAR